MTTGRTVVRWGLSVAVMIAAGCFSAGCLAAAPATMSIPSEPVAAGDRAGSRAFVGFPEYPSLSPDGKTVVFSWAGDLWSASVAPGGGAGAVCTRLTAHPANERRSAFSPDGSMLAFESDRDGMRNLYVMPVARADGGGGGGGALAGGGVQRVTVSDRPQSLAGWTPDGKGLTFHAVLEPTMYRGTRMYRVDLFPSDVPGASAQRPMAAIGGPATTITPAYGSWPRFTNDGSALVFDRNPSPPERPAYRGSGTGDIWRLTTADGSFSRVTDDPANDYEPWPLPDGSVVFISSRDGQDNLWRSAPVAGGQQGAPTQLTRFAPAGDQGTIGHGVRDLAVSGDGSTAVFAVWDRLYRLDLARAGAQPEAIDLIGAGDYAAMDVQRVSADKEAAEAALSPDGKTIAIVARGEVFVRNTTEGYPTRRVTQNQGRERDLAWSPDGRVLYFVSDIAGMEGAGGENGAGEPRYHIYQATVTLAREDLLPERDKSDADDKKDEADKKDEKGTDKSKEKADGEDAAKPDAKSDAKSDEAKPKKPKDKKPDFGKRWAEALRFKIEPVTEGKAEERHPQPSPDGRLLIYSRNLGDMVLRNLETGQERVLLAGWNEPEVAWAPDSRHIVYAAEDLDFNADIWLLDTGEKGETGAGVASANVADVPAEVKAAKPINLTQHPDNDTSPRLSADGKVLTFLSERGTSNDQFDVYQVYLDRSLEGMTAYERDEYFKKAAEAAGKRKPAPTPDFVLKRLTPAEKGERPKADADKQPGKEPEKQSDRQADKSSVPAAEAPKDESKEKPADAKAGDEKPKAKAKKPEPLKFDAEDAYMRIRRVTNSPGTKSDLAVTPGADRIMFSAPSDGPEPAFVSIDHKGQDRKTLQAGNVSEVSVSLTGDKAVYIRQGVASTISPKGAPKADPLPIDAPLVVSVPAQQRQKFLEAARTFGDRFYHPTMKGLNWGALTRRYLPLAEQTRTSEGFNRVVQMLFGETEGSHTGISGGSGPPPQSPAVGYLGVHAEPAPGGYRVADLAPDSPAAVGPTRLEIGDVIVSIDGRRLAETDTALPTIDLDAALAGRAGRETLVEFRRTAQPAASTPPVSGAAQADAKIVDGLRVALITPAPWNQWDIIHYNHQVRSRRAAVEKASGGRLGYLHIRGMGEAEVRTFERDLYAAAHGKEGLVIDVRDNGGGSTADILLSSLTAPLHAYTAPRGVDLKDVPKDAYPRDRRLIYGYTRPINVLINQNSFSNAEIFAHAIKTIGRGRLIGTATFGGVISTGAFTLVDGTTVRMPFRGWYLPGGADMENNGAQPDIAVPATPADEGAGRDAQLEAAVQDLLRSIDAKR